jgi:hypothetical protein
MGELLFNLVGVALRAGNFGGFIFPEAHDDAELFLTLAAQKHVGRHRFPPDAQ